MLRKIKSFFTQPDQDLVLAYQYKMPDSIGVGVSKDGGVYIAKIEKINEQSIDSTTTFLVESESMQGLVIRLNDLLFDYLEFPEDIKAYMPKLLPPREFLAQEGALLSNSKVQELVFAR